MEKIKKEPRQERWEICPYPPDFPMEEIKKEPRQEPWEIFPYPPDFKITIGDLTLKCHKPLLGLKSPVFKSMFEANMAEHNYNTTDKLLRNRLIIEDIDKKSFLIFLRYLYEPEKGIDFEDLSMGLLTAANKYMVQPLFEVFKNSLGFVDVDNAIECAIIACQNDDLPWRSKLVDFIAQHFKQIRHKENFKILKREVDFMVDVFDEMSLEPACSYHNYRTFKVVKYILRRGAYALTSCGWVLELSKIENEYSDDAYMVLSVSYDSFDPGYAYVVNIELKLSDWERINTYEHTVSFIYTGTKFREQIELKELRVKRSIMIRTKLDFWKVKN